MLKANYHDERSNENITSKRANEIICLLIILLLNQNKDSLASLFTNRNCEAASFLQTKEQDS
jgi:hypothetical protein